MKLEKIGFSQAKYALATKMIILLKIASIIINKDTYVLHVIFKLSVWDNKDMVASLIGTIVATTIYFKLRKLFIN